MEKDAQQSAKLQKMIEQLDTIIAYAQKRERKARKTLEKIHPEYQKSAVNLLHYRAFRTYDLRSLQKKLGHLGLSRMAQAQLHVLASLQKIRSILTALYHEGPIADTNSSLSFKEGRYRFNKNTKSLFGPRPTDRRTRIMVTMPSEAADDPQLVRDMLAAGMNCARVNCAHDEPSVWAKIIANIRQASRDLSRPCRVAMDLAGPKIRTGAIQAGPRVLKLKPHKDLYGKIKQPLEIWIGPEAQSGLPHLPVAPAALAGLATGEQLVLRDTRGKKRYLEIGQPGTGGYYATLRKTTFVKTGLAVYRRSKKGKQKAFEVGRLPAIEIPLLLSRGDRLRLDREARVGANASADPADRGGTPAHISCTASAIFGEVKVGERILFDDGKIEGHIRGVHRDHLNIEITQVVDGRAKLRADKGINLPDSVLSISGLTEKDKRDLVFVVEHADLVNFSFVNRPADVRELHRELKRLNARNKLGIVLKIETKNGYNQLTDILMEAMRAHPIGVMIARGDLAVESGWQNIGQEQEEILSICRAAHVTDIWATQVLEGLAKRGLPSRAEITDAVMAQRADCVMLNKGPYIVPAISLLHTILSGMEPFRDRNVPFSPKMKRL